MWQTSKVTCTVSVAAWVKLIGVSISSDFSWMAHIDSVCYKAKKDRLVYSTGILTAQVLLAKVKNFLDLPILDIIYKILDICVIQPHTFFVR